MFDRASLKLGLDKAVLQSMSGRDGTVSGVCTLLLYLGSVSLLLSHSLFGHKGIFRMEKCLASTLSAFSSVYVASELLDLKNVSKIDRVTIF